MEEIFHFEETWSETFNALLKDKEGRFYLTDTPGEDGEWEDIRRVSVADALEWYATGENYSSGSSGNVSKLCKVAAELMHADGD